MRCACCKRRMRTPETQTSSHAYFGMTFLLLHADFAAKMEPFEQAGVALTLLQSAAEAHPAVDASGAVLAPLPGAHRALASPACLPHLVQVQ